MGQNSLRFNKYVTDFGAVDEGNYYTCISPTPGTGIAMAVGATSLANADTAPFIALLAGLQPVQPRFLRLTCTTAPGSGASVRMNFRTDAGARAQFGPGLPGVNAITGGTTLTPVQRNGTFTNKPAKAQVMCGAISAPALTGAAQLLDGDLVRPADAVVGDTYEWRWGAPDGAPNPLIKSGTALVDLVLDHAGYTIAPNSWWFAELWVPSMAATAGAFEVEFGFVEGS